MTATEPDVKPLADDVRAELIEGLRNLVHAARREFPKVGTLRAPTKWDARHKQINNLLDELEALDRGQATAPHA